MSDHRPAAAPLEAEPTGAASSGVRHAAARDDADAAAGSPEAARWRLGTTIAGYRLEAVLGVGGTAAVYRGVREGGGAAAIKVLHGWLGEDPRARRRFLREAAVSNRLSHPAVARMLAQGEEADGTAYLVMELAHGETLEARRAASGGRLPVEEVLRCAGELLSVLAVAHAQGIVHRDVKPGNLLLSPEGALRVLDFGIARATELSDAPTLVTRSGAVLGTVFFMAPEQALGVRDDVDARSDVWAVGATMFTLLTGQLVHRARTLNEALVLAATQAAPPIRTVMPELPRPVASVIDRALAFDRRDRFADGEEMRAALRQAMSATEGEGTAAAAETLPETTTLPEHGSVSPGPRSAASTLRRRLPAVLAVGIGTALLAAATRFSGLWSGPSEVTPEGPEPSTTTRAGVSSIPPSSPPAAPSPPHAAESTAPEAPPQSPRPPASAPAKQRAPGPAASVSATPKQRTSDARTAASPPGSSSPSATPSSVPSAGRGFY